MCLLDRVVAWDDGSIRCTAASHRDAAHPLREANGLSVWAGIEYAAQVAAVHGSLVAGDAAPRQAVLGKARDVSATRERLDDVEGDLDLEARVKHRDPAGAVYEFEVRGGGSLVLQGQFTLMFRDPAR